MRRIKSAGTGFIKLDERLINLKDYKSVGPFDLGHNEDPSGRIRYAIAFTPSNPSQEDKHNNVDGTWFVTYNENEKKDFDKDCKVVVNASLDESGKLNSILIALGITIIGGLVILFVEKYWFGK